MAWTMNYIPTFNKENLWVGTKGYHI